MRFEYEPRISDKMEEEIQSLERRTGKRIVTIILSPEEYDELVGEIGKPLTEPYQISLRMFNGERRTFKVKIDE